MSSSVYRFSIVAKNLDSNKRYVDLAQSRFYTTESSEDVEVAYRPSGVYILNDTIIKNLFSEKKSISIFVESSQHTCRETLLNAAYNDAKFFNVKPYLLPIIFVEYTREGFGMGLSPEKVNKCKEFGNLFYGNENYPIRIVKDFTGKDSILMSVYWNSDNKESLMESLLELSLILYIMRNDHIMNYVLENYQGLSRRDMLGKLSTKFLEMSWGDGANPSLAMSLYCYMKCKNFCVSHEFYINGPARYAQHLHSTDILYNYAKTIYMPTMGTNVDYTYSVAENLRKDILIVLSLLKLEEKDAGQS